MPLKIDPCDRTPIYVILNMTNIEGHLIWPSGGRAQDAELIAANCESGAGPLFLLLCSDLDESYYESEMMLWNTVGES